MPLLGCLSVQEVCWELQGGGFFDFSHNDVGGQCKNKPHVFSLLLRGAGQRQRASPGPPTLFKVRENTADGCGRTRRKLLRAKVAEAE